MMHQTLCINQNQTLLKQASNHLKMGFSIIPLIGKKPFPNMQWRIYQHHAATHTQLELWFMDERTTGYGVICGKVSNNLFVLDFDCPQRYISFKQRFPDLTDTYTVATQRGYHVYLIGETETRTQHFNKLDIIGKGGYVVGSGSQNNHHHYQITIDTPIKQITSEAITSLISWAQGAEISPDSTTCIKDVQSTDLSRLYQQHAPQIGRNNALFQLAILARKNNISRNDVEKQLIPLHIHTSPYGKHIPETKQQRYTEAIQTIHSAYKSTRKQTTNSHHLKSTIPNNIREALLQQSQSSLPGRVLEALYQSEFSPGTAISMTDAIHIGTRHNLAPTSIRKVLHNKLINLIEKITPPAGKGDISNCKLTINRGRPPLKCYVIPTIENLCEKLGVSAQTADEIQEEALQSAKAYRMALHQALIRRAQPECSAAWHGRRLGVCRRTIQRYNKELKIVRVPVIEYRMLDWGNVNEESHFGKPNPQFITPGQWLEVEGKRYPAKKGIALRLLKQGRAGEIFSCSQKPSRYYSPDDAPAIDVLWRLLNPATKLSNDGVAVRELVRVNLDVSLHNKSAKPVEQGRREYLLNDKQRRRSEQLDVRWDFNPPDDLTVIRGIGFKRQLFLNALGIFTLHQLATVDAEDLLRIGGWGSYVKLHTIKRWVNTAHIKVYGHPMYSKYGTPLFESEADLWDKREDWFIEMQEHTYHRAIVDIKRLAFISKQDDEWRERWGLLDEKYPLWWEYELQAIRDEFRRRGIPDEKFKALVDSV